MTNYNIKTVPNQKVVKVGKEKCDKNHLYAAINLEAMEQAALNLDAGAFKLWCYFAKNQDGFEFALSSKAVEETFGIKKRQYDNAIAQLIDKKYLTAANGSNRYSFNEGGVVSKEHNEDENKNSVVSKSNNVVVSFGYNDVVSKSNNGLYQKDTRNNTNTTLDNTKDNTNGELSASGNLSSIGPEEKEEKPVAKEKLSYIKALGVPYDVFDAEKNLIRVKATGKLIEVY